MATNILILSCGTRNKIVQYFKENFATSKVVAADCNPFAPALYEADEYVVTPRYTDNNYFEQLEVIFKKHDITGVISLIDPELSVLSAQKEKLDALGIEIIGSEEGMNNLTLDKWEMYNWFVENDFKCAKTYIDIEEFKLALKNQDIDFPVMVKPILGSASNYIHKVGSLIELERVWAGQDDLLIQEFLSGQEIGIDCYIDLKTKELVNIFLKEKLLMKSGETDKAISFKDDKLVELIESFLGVAKFTGPIDIDMFRVDDEYYFSEINPRFGGGYPHAYECGVNFIKNIKNNLEGKKNPKTIGNYDSNILMMKYSEVFLKKL